MHRSTYLLTPIPIFTSTYPHMQFLIFVDIHRRYIYKYARYIVCIYVPPNILLSSLIHVEPRPLWLLLLPTYLSSVSPLPLLSTLYLPRQEFEAERKPDLRRDVYLQDIHCVSSLCKAYFRELPDPLLTYRLYDKFAVS